MNKNKTPVEEYKKFRIFRGQITGGLLDGSIAFWAELGPYGNTHKTICSSSIFQVKADIVDYWDLRR